MNNSERDSRITFLEEPHLYLIDGKEVPGLQSVTQFVHSFFPHFNVDNVIQNMMKSKNWSTSKYFGKTVDEIKLEWDNIRDNAALAGTKMHLAIEQYYNSIIDPTIQLDQDKNVIDSIEYQYFQNFLKDHSHLKPYKTEWRIFDEIIGIAGSIDMVYHDPNEDGAIYIYDWKRSKKIQKTNYFQKGLLPLEYMDDCNYNHYKLQLNVYKKIIETNYNLKVNELAIVVFHPNNSDYKKYIIESIDDEIEMLFETRRKFKNE